MDPKELVVARNLTKEYASQRVFVRPRYLVRAVNDVDIQIQSGTTLGLVGESGCGKSTLGRLLLWLEEPTKGNVIFNGLNLAILDESQIRKLRRDMQIIFQDSYSALNPRRTVGNIIEEPFTIFTDLTPAERHRKVRELLEEVSLAATDFHKFPHEFSGGQRQRIGIARAIALQPKFIVCDEPVSSLDVSIQAQIINLLNDLKKRYNLTYLFISHDLSVVQCVSCRIAVMYLGRILEMCNANDLFRKAKHPYTRALISASPIPDPGLRREKLVLKGEITSEEGGERCNFYPRCYERRPECSRETPDLKETEAGHLVRCFLYA